MSFNLHIHNFTGMTFRRLVDHDAGRASFVATFTALECVSQAQTVHEAIFATESEELTERFARAVDAFNREMLRTRFDPPFHSTPEQLAALLDARRPAMGA